MSILLGLHGGRGAGKDTTFGFIHQWAAERGVRAARRGFADALKLSFARIFLPDCTLQEAVIWCDELKTEESGSILGVEWTRGDLDVGETETTVSHEINGRTALQRFGTEAHRDVFGFDFWVDALLPNSGWEQNFIGPMEFTSDPPEICVVTDVRFPNEGERVHLLDGEIWKISRDRGIQDGHSSEAGLPADLLDGEIYNNSGLPELRQKVYNMMDFKYGEQFS